MSVQRRTATLDLPVHAEKGMRCGECAARVCAQVEEIAGVLHVECDPRGAVRVDYDAERLSVGDLEAATRRFGAELEGVYQHAMWRIGGLDCPDCARTVAMSVEMLPGVVSAELNFASAMLLVEHEAGSDPSRLVVRAIESAGHSAEPVSGVAIGVEGEPVEGAGARSRTRPGEARAWARAHRTEVAVIGSGGFILLGWVLGALTPGEFAGSGTDIASAASFLLALVFGETLLAPRALVSIRARSLDMNVLMTIAVVGAAAIGQFEEAATVVFLFAFGGWLEARALARTRNSIRGLMELAPPVVRLSRNGEVIEVEPGDARVGELAIVRPGERIALDGEVLSGVSAVDESAVTGEPVPAAKGPGDAVFAGSLNGSGLLEVRITATAEDSTLARIVYLVEEAQASRAPAQLLVDRFSRVYTPVAVAVAALVAVGPPLLAASLGDAVPALFADWGEWLYRGLVVLVAACPCALVISTPVTFVSAIARAGRDGVLVKGGAYLELAARLNAIAFDKTGTLTVGRPVVTDVVAAAGGDASTLVALAASLEAHSNHPLATAVLACAEDRSVAPLGASQIEEMPGRGVAGTVGALHCELVSPAFAEEIAHVSEELRAGIEATEALGRTVLVLIEDGVATGYLGVSDPVRGEARDAVAALLAGGVSHAVMLTGDNERTAEAVAASVGIPAHMARLLPEDKVDAVLRVKERYGTVAMVGDGVNDAPALAAADLGIAMGAAGSDTALEIADVALLGDDLSALPRFLALGRRTVSIVRANVTFSVVSKLAVLVAAVFGRANMWLAVFADTGVALLVILNGMRLLHGATAGRAPVAPKPAAEDKGEL